MIRKQIFRAHHSLSILGSLGMCSVLLWCTKFRTLVFSTFRGCALFSGSSRAPNIRMMLRFLRAGGVRLHRGGFRNHRYIGISLVFSLMAARAQAQPDVRIWHLKSLKLLVFPFVNYTPYTKAGVY